MVAAFFLGLAAVTVAVYWLIGRDMDGGRSARTAAKDD